MGGPTGGRGTATQTNDFGYANLAIRGRTMSPILAEQLDPAIALEPDLITVYASGNDLIRPRCDVDALGEVYDEAIGELTCTGATVGLFAALDPGGGGPFARLRGRFAIYNERVREIAERHGAVVLDSWRMRPERPDLMWSEDRLHLGPLGHRAIAIEVLDTLGVPHQLDLTDPTGSLGESPFRAGKRADLDWVVEHRGTLDQATPHREVLRRRHHGQAAHAGADLTPRECSGTILHAGQPGTRM